MGEVCGAKLVHEESVEKAPEACKTCQNIETKRRRLRREQENIARWKKEGEKFAASIEKAENESAVLKEQIQSYWVQRPSIAMMKNGQANGLGPSRPMHSAATSQASAQSTGYGDSTPSRHSQGGQNGGSQSGGNGSQGGRHTPSQGPASGNRHAPNFQGSTGSRHA